MMKTIKFYALLLLTTAVVFGCSKYDDTELRNDVSDLQSRVEKLEKWCETTNTQISALQGVVTALEAKDFVTGVTPITEGSVTVGYTITFSKSGAVTIKHGVNGKDGVNGVTPIIGVAKHTDGLYYWTVKSGAADATWMLDAEGKMIRTTGDKGADGSMGADGNTPVLSVAADTDGKLYWKVNGEWLMSDGKKVQATGNKGDKGETGAAGSAGEAGKDGDSIFKKDGIDLTDPNNVTFTLNDGKDTKITFPRTSGVKIFDSFDNFKITTLDVATPLTLSLNIKDADYKAIKAELTSSAGLSTAIQTRAADTPWEVAITAPTFKADGTVETQPIVSITASNAAKGDIALLKVTVIDSKGDEHASTRVVEYKSTLEVQTGNIIINGGNVAVATLTINNNSSFNIDEQGILYSKESELNITSSNKLDVTLEEDGSAKIFIEDLEPGTVYYYCSFAKSDGNFVFGETKHFTTSSQVWPRKNDYKTDFNSDICINDFTAIKIAGDGRAWHVVPIKVTGLPDYVLASSCSDVRSLFAGKLSITGDADNILQYAADFTDKILPGISLYAIDIDGFLVGADRVSAIEILISSSPITTVPEANAAEKIGNIQFSSANWQESKDFLIPAKYSNTKCYIAIRNKAAYETSMGVLLGEFITTSLVEPDE